MKKGNSNRQKKQRIIAAVIVGVLVLAMLLSVLPSMLLTAA